MLDYYFNDNLAGNLELLISNVGGKYGYEWFQQQIGITHQYAVKYKVQYLQFPATIKMVTNEIGYMKYYLNFGVAPSFKLAVKRSTIDKDLATMKEISNFQDIKKPEDINFFNCHVVVGGGLMYSLSDNTSALIGLSYQNGFVHANATGINSTLPNWYALRNRYLSLNLGIVF